VLAGFRQAQGLFSGTGSAAAGVEGQTWHAAEEVNRTEAEKNAAHADRAEAPNKVSLTSAANSEIRAAAHGWATPGGAPRFLEEGPLRLRERRHQRQGHRCRRRCRAQGPPAPRSGHRAAGPNPDAGQGARGGLSVADQIRDAERYERHPRSASA
jgi:hypothetical protein